MAKYLLIIAIIFNQSVFASNKLNTKKIIKLANIAIDSFPSNQSFSTQIIDSIKNYSNINSAEIKAYYFHLLGLQNTENDSLDEAIMHYQNSYKLSLELNNYPLYIRTIINLSKLWVNNKEYKISIKQLTIALEHAKKLHLKKETFAIYMAFGNVYIEQNSFSKAQEYYQMASEFGNATSVSNQIKAHYNLAICNFYTGNYDKAIVSNFKALKLAEKIDNTRYIAICLNNIGGCFERQKAFDKAITHYKQAAEKFKFLKHDAGYARALGNIGNMLLEQNNASEALGYHMQALEINKKANNQRGIAKCYNDIANTLKTQQNFSKAIQYYNLAIKQNTLTKYKYGNAITLHELGDVYYKTEQYSKAKEAINESNKLLIEIDDKNLIMKNQKILSQAFFMTDNFEQAFKAQTTYLQLFDSIFTESKNKQITEIESKYQLDKKNQKIKFQEDQLHKDKTIKQLYIFSMIMLTLVIGIIIWLLNKNKAAQRKIAVKNQLLIKQQKHITNSIYYAERIQKAVQPTFEYLQQNFKNCYQIYLPKDIVSGDFIWSGVVKNNTYLAIADCTGHGVPGGFMSMLGLSFLNEIVAKNYELNTGAILDKMREFIKNSLQQSGAIAETNDGINIILCKFSNDFTKLEYSSAQQPALILTNHNSCEKLKYDRQPVGVFYKESNFNTYNLDLKPGYEFVFYSDGIIDQMNAGGTKFSTKRLQNLCKSIFGTTATNKKESILNAHEKWKGHTEQIDDIITFGFSV